MAVRLDVQVKALPPEVYKTAWSDMVDYWADPARRTATCRDILSILLTMR
jgi:hypothetical protein